MKTGTFMNIVGIHYDEIKSLFKSRVYKSGGKFDEDTFNDAFIKCAQRFNNTELSYEFIVKYFWTTYINTYKGNIGKERQLETVELDVNVHDCIDESTNNTNIYNMVMDAISLKYGDELMLVYSLYKLHGWSKDDLIDAGYIIDDHFDDNIKEIHKFVKTYCKKRINDIW